MVARAPWLAPLVVGAIGVVLVWPFRFHPKPGVDISWRLGLHQAAIDGLNYGSQIVFTYGPLGFLGRPMPFVGLTSALSFAATVALYLVAVLMVFQAARRLFRLVVALLVTFLVARSLLFIQPFELVEWLGFAFAFEVLRRDRVERTAGVAAAAGGLASIGLLGKVDVGAFLAVGGVVLVLAVSRRRARDLTVYVATLVAASLALWLVTGQQLTDLGGYARGTYEIIAGYSDAMGVAHDRGRLLAAMFALMGALIVAAAYLTSRGWPRVRRLALAVLLAILLFALWKQGFVRDHFAATFAALPLTLLLLAPRRELLLAPRRAPVAVIGIAMLLTLGVAIEAGNVSPVTYLNPIPTMQQFWRQVRVVVRPWHWDTATAGTRRWLDTQFRVPPDVRTLVAGRTVSIDPYAAGVATAYPDIVWSPVPVFQTYSAYTTYLDELNANVLRSPDRPAIILRHFQRSPLRPATIYAVDGRNYWFESPAATLERLCRYRETLVSGRWQVLADTGRGCGPPVTLGTVSAARGEAVAVPQAPAPDEIVIVRVHGTNDGLLGRLQSTLWKSPQWEVTLNGTPYRLVPGTAADGLVLSVPAAAQGSGVFAFGAPVRTISIRERGSSGRGGELSYEFEAVPLPAP